MRFTTALFAVTAFTGLATAVEFTNSVFNNVTAGKPFVLSWTNATGPVTITLKNGEAADLKTVSTIGSGLSGGTFTWNVPATTPADTYAFEIKDSAGVNYSTRWQIIGGAAVVSSSSAAPTASAPSNSTRSAPTTPSGTPSSSPTGSSNLTTTRGSTPTQSGSRPTSSSTPTQAPNNNSGMALTSNVAFVMLVIGALMTLN